MVVALTQSGKTGCMVSLIDEYLNRSENIIPLENIYIITGLSSCEWLNQTKERLPESIQKRVYHRNELDTKFADDIRTKKNVLIIMDEIQVAARTNNTIYKVFKRSGFYDKEYLLRNDVKIIEFTATPDGTIYDLMKWGEHATHLKMEPGENYKGCVDFKNEGRVYQYKDLCCYSKKTNEVNEETAFTNIKEINNIIHSKYNQPMYHIIRTPNGAKGDMVIDNFKKCISQDINYIKYDGESDIKDINNILEEKPKVHTFIFIKEKIRCAKTLRKMHLGVAYERYTKSPDDAVIIQGLIGRLTGYHDIGKSICFTNIDSIIRYEKLYNSNFQNKTVKWKSKTTKTAKKILQSKGTYNNASLIDGMNTLNEEEEENIEPTIMKFKTQEEAIEYYKQTLKPLIGGRGPRKRKQNANGYFTSIIGNKNDKERPRTTTEIYNYRNYWLTNQRRPYRFYACYNDLADKTTLEFWLIYHLN